MSVNPFAEATRPIHTGAPATPAPFEKPLPSLDSTSSQPATPAGVCISLRLEFDPAAPATPAQYPLIQQATEQALTLLECLPLELAIEPAAILTELILPTHLSVQRLAWAIVQAVKVATLTMDAPSCLSGQFTARNAARG